ncbi:E3 ubiquitin/ISG15 ligase TRIM25-like [Ascaphus truei]|uniref:E3 ubiquitin/ISG15 ligase TRIM25-like n=1 Tax=Ascaphus truei TaxID=8439 RepID=UPI003F5903DB
MASVALSEELSCSICLTIYTNPVMLTCGHNFCQDCIAKSLDSQRGSRVYSCPECRAEFQQRPSLQRNLKLCNIADHYRSTRPNMNETGILCTYCVDRPVPAVKTCLQCEASLCDIHLKPHSKSVNHILIEPTASLEDRKCSIHNELLKYFCITDCKCICVTCCLAGKHSGHQQLLDEACENKKVKLFDFVRKLSLKKGAIEKQLQQLQERRKGVERKVMGIKHSVTALFGDIKEQLVDLENEVLNEVTRQEEQVLLPLADLIQKLEIEAKDIYNKMLQVRELYYITDPLSLLKQSAIGINSKKWQGGTSYNKGDPASDDHLDEVMISVTLQRALYKLSDSLPDLKATRGFHVGDASDTVLNINAASACIDLSQDLKTASNCSKERSRPPHPETFTTQQVLSTRNLSSGQHYWEVETSDEGDWAVGVTYKTIKRKGDTSFIGRNCKSWCLTYINVVGQLIACHDNEFKDVYLLESARDLGIYLDYEGGRLSFYELSEPIRHLHTFTATFTDPLYAAFYVNDDAWISIRS